MGAKRSVTHDRASSETLSDEVRAKMHAAPQASYPEITPDDLKGIDGLIIGAPTRSVARIL